LDYLTIHTSRFQKGCIRLAAASDKVYQLLVHGRWFSPASSTTKTGCHDIAEILLKVALKHPKKIKSEIITQVCIWYERLLMQGNISRTYPAFHWIAI
jgi:hypothetical protein